MDNVEINWDKEVTGFDLESISKSENPKFKQKGFYAILAGTFNSETKMWSNIQLLYIGQAFEQTLRERIPQEHDAYKCVLNYPKQHAGYGIVIMLGTIEKPDIRLTQELFNDIECCLIFSNKPLCNEMSTESHSGRDLQITNVGHPSPLKRDCPCSETKPTK